MLKTSKFKECPSKEVFDSILREYTSRLRCFTSETVREFILKDILQFLEANQEYSPIDLEILTVLQNAKPGQLSCIFDFFITLWRPDDILISKPIETEWKEILTYHRERRDKPTEHKINEPLPKITIGVDTSVYPNLQYEINNLFVEEEVSRIEIISLTDYDRVPCDYIVIDTSPLSPESLVEYLIEIIPKNLLSGGTVLYLRQKPIFFSSVPLDKIIEDKPCSMIHVKSYSDIITIIDRKIDPPPSFQLPTDCNCNVKNDSNPCIIHPNNEGNSDIPEIVIPQEVPLVNAIQNQIRKDITHCFTECLQGIQGKLEDTCL